MADYFKFFWLSQYTSSLPGDGESYLVQLALVNFRLNEDVKKNTFSKLMTFSNLIIKVLGFFCVLKNYGFDLKK